MKQSEAEINVSNEGARRKSPLRWVVRGTFVVCGTLMAMVVLSEPAVRSQVSAGTDWLASLVAPRDDVAMMDTETAPPVPGMPQKTQAEPRVSAMPTSRIPVHRGNVVRER